MVALTSFLIVLMQSLGMAAESIDSVSPPAETTIQECTTEVESPDDSVIRVCLSNEEGKTVLVISRYLGSGEVAEERIPFSSLKLTQETKSGIGTTSLIAKSLDDDEVIKAKNFVRSPTSFIK